MTEPRFASNADRVANRAELKAEIESAFEDFTRDTLIQRLEAHKVPCGRVRTIAEAITDPQVATRDMLPTFQVEGFGAVGTLGTPVKLSRTPAVVSLAPPSLGEHTDEVLADLVARPRIRAR